MCIAMDNFGAGLSPLTHLRRLPLRQVKIDRSLIQTLSDSDADLVLVSTIISLATKLGLEVVAEGVETQVSREILQNNGCSNYQGFCSARRCQLRSLRPICSTAGLAPSPASSLDTRVFPRPMLVGRVNNAARPR